MELAKAEIAVIEKTISELTESQMRQLNELELALIGGGCGEVVFG